MKSSGAVPRLTFMPFSDEDVMASTGRRITLLKLRVGTGIQEGFAVLLVKKRHCGCSASE